MVMFHVSCVDLFENMSVLVFYALNVLYRVGRRVLGDTRKIICM